MHRELHAGRAGAVSLRRLQEAGAGAAGHVVVAGGPQSGKSTTLRALVTAAALTHTPAELAFQVVDLGGRHAGRAERCLAPDVW